MLSREIPPGTLDPNDDDETRWGKITNPTVHIGLNQLRRLLNAIIRVHGRPDEIVVELARELKLNEKDKAKYNKELGENTRKAQARSGKLAELGQTDHGGNRMLLRLWEELSPNSALNHFRSEEHTSELQSLMRISYAVFCLKKKKNKLRNKSIHNKYN